MKRAQIDKTRYQYSAKGITSINHNFKIRFSIFTLLF